MLLGELLSRAQSLDFPHTVFDPIDQKLLLVLVLMPEGSILQQFLISCIDLLGQREDVVGSDVLLLNFLLGQVDVDAGGEVFDVEVFGLKSEVLDGVVEEGLFVADDLAVVGVDDWVALVEEAVDAADLVEVIVPLFGVFDDDSEIDVLVLGLDLAGDLLAVGRVDAVR